MKSLNSFRVVVSVVLSVVLAVTFSRSAMASIDADTVDGFDAYATAQPNALLALDSNSKLPADITGDADTVDGYHATDFDDLYLSKTQNTSQDNGLYIGTDQVRARDSDGLKLTDDSDNGIFVKDGGNVGVGTTNPGVKLEVNGAIKAGYDSNITSYLGRAAIGYNTYHSDYATFAHVDQNNGTSYALAHYPDGTTFLNAASGKNIRFRIANLDVMKLSSAGLGINTTAATSQLAINAVSSIQRIMDVYGTDSNPIFTLDNLSNSGDIRLYNSSGTRMRLAPSGYSYMADTYVCIGDADSAYEQLDVAGTLCMRSVGTPPNYTADTAKFYCNSSGEMIVLDDAGNDTQLSSHKDPRSVAGAVDSSFGNPDITIPWSFHHSNALIGKGAVVDMAKMAAWVEAKMKAELGQDAGTISFEYDLDPSRIVAPGDYQVSQVKSQIRKMLKDQPWVELAVAADGSVPEEALEKMELMEKVEVEKTVKEFKLDPQTGKIVAVESVIIANEMRGMGQYEYKLKEDCKLEKDGRLYRKRTAADLTAAEISSIEMPAIPAWIEARIHDNKKFNENTLEDIIHQALKEMTKQGKASQIVAMK